MLSHMSSTNQNVNFIPIGTNYQAQIPQMIPEQFYKIRSR
jgi:hypothetical protein